VFIFYKIDNKLKFHFHTNKKVRYEALRVYWWTVSFQHLKRHKENWWYLL